MLTLSLVQIIELEIMAESMIDLKKEGLKSLWLAPQGDEIRKASYAVEKP